MLSDSEKLANGILIPHFYDIKWSRDLNKILSEVFYCPKGFESSSYLPSRSTYHSYLAEILPIMRSNKVKRVFFANLEDFTLDVFKAGFVKETYGILHGSNFDENEPGAKSKFQSYELGVANLVTKIFTSTKFFAHKILYETTPIGLPILDMPSLPSSSDKILFNHRLNSEKNPEMLLLLPKRIRDRVVVTAPKYATECLRQIKDDFDIRLNLPDSEYFKVMDGCGYGISFASYDNFGYSVIEGYMHGLLYFLPYNATTCYQELYLPPVFFGNVSELISRIEWYDEHKRHRDELVSLTSQKLFKNFNVNTWLKRLGEKIDGLIIPQIKLEKEQRFGAWK